MSTTTTQTEWRPFHETILDNIRLFRHEPRRDESRILLILHLLQTTKIPKGHDEIIAAIDEYFSPAQRKLHVEIDETKASILEQKQAAAKKDDGE